MATTSRADAVNVKYSRINQAHEWLQFQLETWVGESSPTLEENRRARARADSSRDGIRRILRWAE